MTCRSGTFPLERARPTLLFVIDRSRSMLDETADKRTRWDVLNSALMSTLPPFDDTVAMGVMMFPLRGENTSGSCMVAGAPDLMPGFHQASQVLKIVSSAYPAGLTPTSDAIGIAAQAMQSVRAATRARALVLATDGLPDCNPELNPATCQCSEPAVVCASATRCLDDARTMATLQNANAAGVPTYVIGIQDVDSNLNVAVLDAMADAGGRPQLGLQHRYYAATSELELSSALVKIGMTPVRARTSRRQSPTSAAAP
ncbi:MAG: vWA domain-containing protein [Polyangiaceae bacterium]